MILDDEDDLIKDAISKDIIEPIIEKIEHCEALNVDDVNILKSRVGIYKFESNELFKKFVRVIRDNDIYSYLCLNWIDTSEITSMSFLFCQSKFNGDISKWDTSRVIRMEHMFRGTDFNGNISNWDVSKVIDMESMFQDSRFNGDISNWDVSGVQNMSHMFCDSDFNKDISQWDTHNVVNMKLMFYRSKFNGDISNWDVSRVKDMEGIFGESSFNGDISQWKTYSLENVKDMFYKSKFSGDISQWDLSLILSEKHTLSMVDSKKHNNCYIYYEEYIKNGHPSEYDYFELTNEFILSKLLNIDCSINMNIIEHSHKAYSMIDILNRSIILMDVKECARLYSIPNEFIKHHVEERMNPIFEDLCTSKTLDELAAKISKINISDLKKEFDNNALLG